jgi:hypothetical protein
LRCKKNIKKQLIKNKNLLEMKDSLKMVADSAKRILNDSNSLNDSTTITNSFHSQVINTSIFDNNIFSRIILPIILLIFSWYLKNLFDKYILIRPKLFLKMGRPLYGQNIIDYNSGHNLFWRYECSLKNNSKQDAYNITILELKEKGEEDLVISNREALKREFDENNHLSSNSLKEFEIKKQIHVGADVLINSRIENGVRVIYPGLKIQNPDKELMPKKLNDIKLIIIYENEKGKKFYTKFTRKNGVERNEIMTRRPYSKKKMI